MVHELFPGFPKQSSPVHFQKRQKNRTGLNFKTLVYLNTSTSWYSSVWALPLWINFGNVGRGFPLILWPSLLHNWWVRNLLHSQILIYLYQAPLSAKSPLMPLISKTALLWEAVQCCTAHHSSPSSPSECASLLMHYIHWYKACQHFDWY